MVTKTALMLFILAGSALLAAYGVWFGIKAYDGWRAIAWHHGAGWMICGSILSIGCFGALLGLAYLLAGALGT